VAKTPINSRRELLYLLFFYICKIKSVKSAEKIRLKKTEKWDENKGTNAVLVDMYFKIVQEQKKISWYGKILVTENKATNSYLLNIN
jgi:hypothetical protein